jgi:hypothetical protein
MSVMAMTPFIGVRISWLMFARNSLFSRVASSACAVLSASFAKASFLLCRRFDFSHVIVTCREPVDLMYRAYQFDDLLSGELINLPYSPGARHKVLCLPMRVATERWRSRNRPLFDFMMNTDHPDIQIDYEHIQVQLARARTASPQALTARV